MWSTATWDIATIMSGAHPGTAWNIVTYACDHYSHAAIFTTAGGVTCLKFNSVVIASGGNDK